MNSRKDTIVLRALRNTACAGCAILLLFAAMAYSLWHLLDSNRILEKSIVIGSIVHEQGSLSQTEPAGAPGRLRVQLLLHEVETLPQEHMTPSAEIKLGFPALPGAGMVRATVLDSRTQHGQKQNARQSFLLEIQPEDEDIIKKLNMQSPSNAYTAMELHVRTKKLWQAAVEKMAL